MSNQRQYSFLDQLLININQGLGLFSKSSHRNRENPASISAENSLTEIERQHSAGLMRVNHSGEVCAQALYKGQALTAKSQQVREQLRVSADEENDHLMWCQERLQELNSHVSYLSPLWFVGSFLIGAFAGLWGDRISLGFIVETEQQVVKHLHNHLKELPAVDSKSRLIIEQMREDEAQHAHIAQTIGAQELPYLVKCLMHLTSKIMTKIAYWI